MLQRLQVGPPNPEKLIRPGVEDTHEILQQNQLDYNSMPALRLRLASEIHCNNLFFLAANVNILYNLLLAAVVMYCVALLRPGLVNSHDSHPSLSIEKSRHKWLTIGQYPECIGYQHESFSYIRALACYTIFGQFLLL